MTLIDDLCMAVIKDRLFGREHTLFTKAVIHYAMQLSSFTEVNSFLKPTLSTSQCYALHDMCTFDSRVTLHLKYALYHSITDIRGYDESACLATFKKYGLLEEDFYQIYPVFLKYAKHRARHLLLENPDIKFGTIQSAKDGCQKLILSSKMKTFVGKFVYRKLRFIASSNNLQLTDLEQDLLVKGIQVYYSHYPFGSDLYLENLVKRSIVNQGNRKILYYTAKCRARNIQDEDGNFYNPVRTFLITGDDGSSYVDPEVDQAVGSEDFKSLEFRMTTDRLTKHYAGPTGVAYRLLLVPESTEAFPEFVKYCRKVIGCRNLRSCEQVLTKLGDGKRYQELVRNYVHADAKAFTLFMEHLQGIYAEQ